MNFLLRKIQLWCHSSLLGSLVSLSRLFQFSPFAILSSPPDVLSIELFLWDFNRGKASCTSWRAHNTIHESAWLSENYIYPGYRIKSLFQCWTFIRSASTALIPGPHSLSFSLTLDRRTKINIVDDENKTLDTGWTGGALTLSSPRPSFSRISRIDMTTRGHTLSLTHSHACARALLDRYVQLNGSICIFYKLNVIRIAGCTYPMLVCISDRVHRRVSVDVSVRWIGTGRQFIAITYGPRNNVGSSSIARVRGQSSHLLRDTDTPISIGMNLTDNRHWAKIHRRLTSSSVLIRDRSPAITNNLSSWLTIWPAFSDALMHGGDLSNFIQTPFALNVWKMIF